LYTHNVGVGVFIPVFSPRKAAISVRGSRYGFDFEACCSDPSLIMA
jgi:hypothetical protein